MSPHLMYRRLRLLWVTPHLPLRGVSAAREHWWSLLARLARRHEITLLAFVDPEDVETEKALPAGLAAVHRVPRMPWRPDDPLALLPRTVAGGFSHPALSAAVSHHIATGRYDLVQLEFTEMAYLMPCCAVPTILTVHQVGFADEGPMWRAQGRGAGRGARLLHRYLRELDFELRAVTRAHHVITLSREDAARLRRFHPQLPLSVSPLGVDCEYFQPAVRATVPEVDLLFVGHFGHPPNLDAARFLVREVRPRLDRSVRLRIVGAGLTPEVAELAVCGSVEVTGPVPDVRPHLAAARVVVAPVRFGTGMRGKVLEALAMGRPVVTTSLGAEGLGAVPDQDLLIADGAAPFAAAVRRLLDDQASAERLGRAGRAMVERRFDWDGIATRYDEIYGKVLGVPGAPPAVLAGTEIAWAHTAVWLGRWPGIGLGVIILLLRAAGWHLSSVWQRFPAGVRRRARPPAQTAA